MAKQTINIGSTANDGTGDPLRTAFDKCNDNFTELYSAVNPTSSNLQFTGNSLISEDTNGGITIDPNGTGTIELASSANVTGTLTVVGGINMNGSLTVDTIVTESNQNLNITPGGTGSIILDGITLADTTISASSSNDSLTLNPSGTGRVNIDGINIKDTTISASNSNDNLVLSASGTGNIVVGALTVAGSTISATDSTQINFNDAVQFDGNIGFYGTTPTAQASAIAFDPSGNDGSTVDDLRQVINSMLTALRNVGIIAS
jgi:hypothetical protein